MYYNDNREEFYVRIALTAVITMFIIAYIIGALIK